jgi:hypothetical protein
MIINTVTKLYSAISNTFSSYQIEYENGTIVSVPLDEANTDYQAIQEWIAEGNTVIDNGGNS